MAAPIIMRSGYAFSQLFQFDFLGDAEDLSSATISASVINLAKTAELITDTAQNNTGTGVSWIDGLVGIVFSSVDTASLTPQKAWIEVAVVLGSSRLPYASIPIFIEKGYTLT